MECRKDLIFYVIKLSVCVISLGTAFQPRIIDSRFSCFYAIQNCEVHIA